MTIALIVVLVVALAALALLVTRRRQSERGVEVRRR
jgi:hypothetical protein